jgi:hypothetical protein
MTAKASLREAVAAAWMLLRAQPLPRLCLSCRGEHPALWRKRNVRSEVRVNKHLAHQYKDDRGPTNWCPRYIPSWATHLGLTIFTSKQRRRVRQAAKDRRARESMGQRRLW